MDPAEYRILCSRPDVMARRHVRATLVRLANSHPALAVRLGALLESDPVPKPEKHTGGTETDFLLLDLPREEIEQIVDALCELEASQAESAISPELANATADLLDRWNRAESSRTDRSAGT